MGGPLIAKLIERRLLSVSTSRSGGFGYRFAGSLLKASEALDARLTDALGAGLEPDHHSCATLIAPDVLERIGFMRRMPSIPFYAVPHGAPSELATDADWVLSPSSCYNTFSHLERTHDSWRLRAFTTRGRCHRQEQGSDEPTRMSAFDMRELVLIGDREEVVREADAGFERAIDLIRAVGGESSTAPASDVFYGDGALAARKVQLALGLKHEVLMPWSDGRAVAVGSRNLHHDLFTSTFEIGPEGKDAAMHSSCVAFGIERLLLTLLAGMDVPDPDALLARLERIPAPQPS